MKKLIITAIISVFSYSGFAQDHGHTGHSSTSKSEKETKKVMSPHTSAMAMVGDAHVHIDYSSPRVRERIIFGGLVGYNTVWQSGAHNVTWLETNKDLVFGDNKVLPAGKYAFFTMPGKDTWKVMFNSHWEQHGKDEYDQAKNVLMLETEPIELKENQEELEFEVVKTGEREGTLSLAWEKVKIKLPFAVKE